jgi:hypothetical protein
MAPAAGSLVFSGSRARSAGERRRFVAEALALESVPGPDRDRQKADEESPTKGDS